MSLLLDICCLVLVVIVFVIYRLVLVVVLLYFAWLVSFWAGSMLQTTGSNVRTISTKDTDRSPLSPSSRKGSLAHPVHPAANPTNLNRNQDSDLFLG